MKEIRAAEIATDSEDKAPEIPSMIGIHYVVRDRNTQGCDFLMWGDDDFNAAVTTLLGCIEDGLDVELAAMPADAMDDLTRELIEG